MALFVVIRVINLFVNIIVTLICVEAIMSWFTGAFGPGLWKAYGIIHQVTDPFIRPFRALLMRFSMRSGIDFSPILAILALEFIARILTRVLLALM
ncbi:MAG: YggT family protein [Anaerovoracaceae bacterium]|nr:YggT family protein [Bacillota bacterium]MDY2670887.1 YggT family protein [Anaerovoracaceae bacterium]